MTPTLLRATLLALLLATVAGCGPDPNRFVPVSGRVTVKGTPLTKGNLTFRPDQDLNHNRTDHPFAVLGPDGRYTVDLHGQPGARLGAYRVTVFATKNEPEDRLDWVPVWLIHPRHTRYETTDLKVEVVENPAPGAYDFDLSPP